MTIRTHKMIKDASDTDTGKMNSRSSIAPATAFYLACDEGSGATVTDNAGSALQLSNAGGNTTVTWGGAANTCELTHSNGLNAEAAPAAGTVPQPLSKSFLVWYHAVPIAIAGTYLMILGTTGGGSALVKFNGGGDWLVEDDSGNDANFDTADIPDATPTQTFFGAIFIDRDNGAGYAYTSDNDATVTLAKQIDASALVDDLSFANTLAINGQGALDTYGAGMYVFTDTPTPTTVLANLEIIRQNQLTSNKSLPVNWLTEE